MKSRARVRDSFALLVTCLMSPTTVLHVLDYGLVTIRIGRNVDSLSTDITVVIDLMVVPPIYVSSFIATFVTIIETSPAYAAPRQVELRHEAALVSPLGLPLHRLLELIAVDVNE